MKKIGIYPGNFQPASRAHLEVYKQLKAVVGNNDVFVATTDREPIPEAPLNFGDKEQIWVRHGVPASHIVKVDSLPTDETGNTSEWRPEAIYRKFSKQHTIVIIVLNEKEASVIAKRHNPATGNSAMSAQSKAELHELYEELANTFSSDEDEGDPDLTFFRPGSNDFEKDVWVAPDGKPQYFQPYKGNEHHLAPFSEHAYIVVLDDSRIDGKPVSTSNIRNVLGSTKYSDDQKKKFFRWVFGWFDVGLYQLMTFKFRMAHQVAGNDEQPIRESSSRITTTKQLQDMVRDVLWEIISEDYSTTINTPDSSTNMTSISGQQQNPAQQRADASKQKADLVKQKQKAERDLDGMEKDLQWKQSDVLRKRKDELPNKRKELDALNKQISQASNPTISTSTTSLN